MNVMRLTEEPTALCLENKSVKSFNDELQLLVILYVTYMHRLFINTEHSSVEFVTIYGLVH